MADVTTTLRLKTDDREARKLGQTLKQSFSPTALREFKRATQDLESQLVRLIRSQTSLNRQLDGVKKGTDAYKAFSNEIKKSNDQIKLVSASLTQLDRIQERSARQQSFSPARNFAAGAAQGLGIAQYIPTEPGMGWRIGGAMAGGAVRAGAAPFTNPGLGGVSQLAGAVPVIGQALAGGLSTAAGAYQTAVGYQRQRREALFQGRGVWGGGEARDFTTAEREQISRAEAALAKAKSTRAAVPLTKAQEDLKTAYDDLSKLGPPPAAGGGTTTALPEDMKVLREPTAAQSDYAKRMNALAEKHARAHETVVKEEEELLRPPMKEQGPDLRPAKQQEKAKAKNDAAVQKAQRALRAAQAPRYTAGMAAQLGLTPQEAMQLQVQFMQARGGRFEEGTDVDRQVGEAAVGAAFGVAPGLAGGLARGAMPGGGGLGSQSELQLIGAAIANGLNGSQISEYLETLVQLQQQAEQTGQKIDEASFAKLSFQMGASGLEGLRAKSIAAGMTTKAQTLSQMGPQTGADIMILRAAGKRIGVDPSEGPEAYALTRQFMAGPQGAEAVTDFVREQIQSARGQSQAVQEMNLVNLMRNAVGAPIGWGGIGGEAEEWLKAELEGGDELENKVKAAMEAASKKAGELPDDARRGVRGAAGALPGEAGLARETIAIGNRVTTSMQGFTRAANAMGEQVSKLNGIMTDLAAVVKKVIEHVGGGPPKPRVPKKS